MDEVTVAVPSVQNSSSDLLRDALAKDRKRAENHMKRKNYRIVRLTYSKDGKPLERVEKKEHMSKKARRRAKAERTHVLETTGAVGNAEVLHRIYEGDPPGEGTNHSPGLMEVNK